MRFSALFAKVFVHCVLACTSPVAVRVAVSSAVAHRQREGTDEAAAGRELYLSWVAIVSGTRGARNLGRWLRSFYWWAHPVATRNAADHR
jgi:hypothetical protein